MRLLINLMALIEEFDERQRAYGHPLPRTSQWTPEALAAYQKGGYVQMHDFVCAQLRETILDEVIVEDLAHLYCEEIVGQTQRVKSPAAGLKLEITYCPSSMDLLLEYKKPPTLTPKQRLLASLTAAEENGDYIPESLRRAYAELHKL